jgi:hypothetical protein
VSGLLGGIKLWERSIGASQMGDVPAPVHT